MGCPVAAHACTWGCKVQSAKWKMTSMRKGELRVQPGTRPNAPHESSRGATQTQRSNSNSNSNGETDRVQVRCLRLREGNAGLRPKMDRQAGRCWVVRIGTWDSGLIPCGSQYHQGTGSVKRQAAAASPAQVQRKCVSVYARRQPGQKNSACHVQRAEISQNTNSQSATGTLTWQFVSMLPPDSARLLGPSPIAQGTAARYKHTSPQRAKCSEPPRTDTMPAFPRVSRPHYYAAHERTIAASVAPTTITKVHRDRLTRSTCSGLARRTPTPPASASIRRRG
jgi:hypothetical protein